MKKIIFFLLFFTPAIFAMLVKKTAKKIDNIPAPSILKSEIDRMYQNYKKKIKKTSTYKLESFEKFKQDVLENQKLILHLEMEQKKLNSKRKIENFIPKTMTVRYLQMSDEKSHKVREKLDVQDELKKANNCEDLLHLSLLQYLFAFFILENIDDFDIPGEEFTYYRVYDKIQNNLFHEYLNPEGISRGDIIQVELGLLHMINYIETTHEKLKNLKTERLHRNTAKSIIGIRPFLTELTYHIKNTHGPKFDKKFVQSFDETPKSIKQAKKELKTNFQRLFWIMRLLPDEKSKTKDETEKKERQQFFNNFIIQNKYYNQKNDGEKQKISSFEELYFPYDMDNEILEINLKKAKEMKTYIGYQPLKENLNPYLALPAKTLNNAASQQTNINYFYGLFDEIKFERNHPIWRREKT